jgi:hypothetical protein
MSTDDRQISELFAKIVAFAEARGVSNINELPGCWETTAEEQGLFIAVNGHGEAKDTTTGFPLDPFHAFVTVNGWPAAVVSPFGGTIMGGWEDDLIARIEAATVKGH